MNRQSDADDTENSERLVPHDARATLERYVGTHWTSRHRMSDSPHLHFGAAAHMIHGVHHDVEGCTWPQTWCVGHPSRASTPPQGPTNVIIRAEAVLIDHQRRDIESCLCGWSELGKSHPEHQALMLASAGLLTATTRPDIA